MVVNASPRPLLICAMESLAIYHKLFLLSVSTWKFLKRPILIFKSSKKSLREAMASGPGRQNIAWIAWNSTDMCYGVTKYLPQTVRAVSFYLESVL